MTPLTVDDFPAYFQELHGRDPYNWQCRLAKQVIEGTWPGTIDLPTGSGKTSCLDIAIFTLAAQAVLPKDKRTAPRRIFFCVNRRVIVDEAHQRAVKIAEKLLEAEGSNSVLGRVAASLRKLSTLKRESAPPLDVLELRGGIYRDNRWARSATQPTIVCTTIDQLGSRLLFRGYGVSANAAPIQAALIAYDSLVLLDEAHISRPFLQTLDYVKRYLDSSKWAEQPVGVKPMIVVPMTATPPEGVPSDQMFALPESDKQGKLKARLEASKKATLRSVPDVVKAAVNSATALSRTGPTAVGIMVNRVATAKAIYEKLREQYSDKPDVVVELVIGSMRPIDRDRQAERLRELVGPDRPERSEKTSFIVATQCLEVGADYDFDALVTECASLDALRQRFGRLNRGGRPIDAKAVILVEEKAIKEESKLDDTKPLDPIYGNALSRTWNWLLNQAEVVPTEVELTATKKRGKKQSASEERVIDFGIDAFTAILQKHDENGRIPANLLAPSALKNAPVMLPAYVDFWCQTSPRPTPEPEVSLFLHGPEAGEPDVQVCWRADLVEDEHIKQSDWCDVVALLPPTSAECMSVPISRIRKWLTDEEPQPEGDLLGTATDDTRDQDKKPRKKAVSNGRVGVLWRGSKESQRIRFVEQLRPGDTLVLPATAGGWNELGHVPEATVETVDVAETAFQTARDHAVLRLHPVLKPLQQPLSTNWPWEWIDELFARLTDSEDPPSEREVRQRLTQIAAEWPNFGNRKFIFEYYPDERGVVLITRERLGQATEWFTASDEGEDERSQSLREEAISLNDHTQHVRDETVRTVNALPLADIQEAYCCAARWHDLGKADERFQAMLRRTDRTDAWLLSGLDTALLAKSDGLPQTPQQRKLARERAGLPEGFRHEMLSVQIVEQSKLVEEAGKHRDLILHLIAAHHGYARPLAPVVIDTECPEVTVAGVILTSKQRLACPPHRIDSGIAERFWDLTRRYGWWGLAYLEAVLRLADQQASADEDEGVFNDPSASVELGEASA
jgi:CRISPR-associated endonuclease/helicase Cas3